MRFAFKTAQQHTTWADMLAVWKEADGIELFESGWNFDHFYPIRGDWRGPCLEGWSMLAALAQATRRLRLGTKPARGCVQSKTKGGKCDEARGGHRKPRARGECGKGRFVDEPAEGRC